MAKQVRPKGGGAVSFHDPPPDEDKKSRYANIIARAKAGNKDKPGDLEGTPRFEDVNTGWDAPRKPSAGGVVSKGTSDGLQAVAEASAAAAAVKAAAEEEENRGSGIGDGVSAEAVASVARVPDSDPVEVEASKEEALKAKIETRVDKLDIGQYLMNGELTQSVPIIPGKLVVTFRTVTDLEECFVDDELSAGGELTARAFLRRANEWALAFHIAEVNGSKWPTTIDGDGTVSEKSVKRRLSHVRKLSSPIFHLLSQNLAWFLERVNDSLNMEALGNG